MNYLSADKTHSARTKLFERPGIGTGGFPLSNVYTVPQKQQSRQRRVVLALGLEPDSPY
jgi:hypothetical protein